MHYSDSISAHAYNKLDGDGYPISGSDFSCGIDDFFYI